MPEKRIDPKELLPYSALSQSEHYDFSEKHQYDDWELPFELTEQETENHDFEPAMNYLYPIAEFKDSLEKWTPKQLKKTVDDAGAITLIRRLDNDEYYLALTGGGMDMSWDICAGYIALGYLPPFTFCEGLPEFAGAKYNDMKHRNVILACQRSITFVKNRAERATKDIQKFVDKTYGSKWRWED